MAKTAARNFGERARHGRSFPRPRGKHGRTGTVQAFVSAPCAKVRDAGRGPRRPGRACSPNPKRHAQFGLITRTDGNRVRRMHPVGHPNPKLILWPTAGVLLGFLAVINPFYAPQISISTSLVCFVANLVLTLWFGGSAFGARVAVLLGGLAMAVPCFLSAKPLERGLLMCLMGLPITFAALMISRPAMPTLRERITFLCAHLGSEPMNPIPRRFDFMACLQLFIATLVFAAALLTVKRTPTHDGWLALRWFAGGVMCLAVGETFTASHNFWSALTGVNGPRFFQSPWLAASVGEFWSRRWNLPTSRLFHRNCFALLARHGVWLAIIATFFLSGVAHFALAFMATMKLNLAIPFGLFFCVQPVLIASERILVVRRWSIIPARIWTIAALTVTAPLFVEPALQGAEPNWGGPDDVMVPTAWVIGVVFLFCGGLALAAAWSRPKTNKSNT